jgi:hypothetical protein
MTDIIAGAIGLAAVPVIVYHAAHWFMQAMGYD